MKGKRCESVKQSGAVIYQVKPSTLWNQLNSQDN